MQKLASGPVGACAFAGPCGAYQVWQLTHAYFDLTCIYDSSGQDLVSATACSDTQDYCDSTSFCQTGGQDVDVAKTCQVSALPQTCFSPTPDGGQGSD